MLFTTACIGLLASLALAAPAPLADRPGPPPMPASLVGDGSPVQKYRYRQEVQPQECGDADSCSGSVSQSYTLTVSATFGLGGGAKNWINGGFGVSEGWTNTETHSCTAKSGDKVCVWSVAAFTEYQVTECSEGDLTCNPDSITSPNNNNQGGGFVCGVNDQCSDQNTEIWKDGPEGGPQSNPHSIDPSNLPGTVTAKFSPSHKIVPAHHS